MRKKYDEIRIEDLEVFANHGVFPEENVLGQKFWFRQFFIQTHEEPGLQMI